MAKKLNIFITGGNRGIGKGLVEHFSKEHDVTYSTRSEKDTPIAGAASVVFDVREEQTIQQVVKSLDKRFDLLINNAGVLYDYQTPALQADIEQIKETFDINTLGPLRVCRAIVPMMNKGGRVLNISSGMGQLSDMGSGAIAYRLSKTALNTLTKVLSNELSREDISVNTLCPGWVKTDMGGMHATRTIKESVSKIAEFALREDFPNGEFVRDGNAIPW
jgi:NAD(P)-dependent dehydrogenase (short-subunit alcohol dehydrogenase family)